MGKRASTGSRFRLRFHIAPTRKSEEGLESLVDVTPLLRPKHHHLLPLPPPSAFTPPLPWSTLRSSEPPL
jgi:hypothetical protein